MSICSGNHLKIFWITLFVLIFSDTAFAMDIYYTVTIDNPASHQAKIKMNVSNLNSDYLTINEIGGPSGYGINVISIGAKDNIGNSLQIQHTPGDGCVFEPDIWEIDIRNIPSIEVNYVIDATKLVLCGTHIDPEYFGYITENFAVLLGAYLFLLPQNISSIESVKVECNLPLGWKIVTPWPQTDGIYYPYSPYTSHFRSLFGGALWCFGEFDVHTTKINSDDVTIAVYKHWDTEKKKNLVNRVLEIYSYQTSIWGSGIDRPWVVVFNPVADDGKWIYGGTSSLSITYTAKDGITYAWHDFATEIGETRWIGYDWGFTSGSNCTWFYAGGGTFYGIKTMLHNNIQPGGPYLIDFYNNYIDYYISQDKDLPLVSLDSIDVPHFEHDMPRIKGVLAVFLVAKELYFRTAGRVKIDDLSRALFNKYWGTYLITIEDFKNEIELLTGLDFTQFFNDYFYGTKIYPIEWAFQDDDSDGLTNEEEIFWDTNPNNSDSDSDGYSDNYEIIAKTDPTDRRSCPGPCPMIPMPWIPLLLLDE